MELMETDWHRSAIWEGEAPAEPCSDYLPQRREEHEEIVGWTERSEFHHFEMLNMKDRTSENGTKQQKSSISYPCSSVFNVFAFSPYHRRVLLQLAQQFFFRLVKSCHDHWSGTISLPVQAKLIASVAQKPVIYPPSDTARERDWCYTSSPI